MSILSAALSDSELVEHTLAGDTAAFELLVHRHRGRVERVAQRMLRDAVEAQDVVQETFLNAFRRLDTFRGDAAFGSWIHRIASNCCLMRLRTRRRRPEVPLAPPRGGQRDGWELPVADPSPLSDQRVESKELGAMIARAVAGLSPSYREVFELADIEHLSMREIAVELELSVPNVKTRLHRARGQLRTSLGGYVTHAEAVDAA